jgi:hypothetical protein
MRIFNYFFYIFFGTVAKTHFSGEPDYDYDTAILGGLIYSIFLSFNIATVLIIIDYWDLHAYIIKYLGFGTFISLYILSCILVFFSSIYKKKYKKIKEHFDYIDKSWKKKIVAVLVVILYMVGSTALLAFVCNFFN